MNIYEETLIIIKGAQNEQLKQILKPKMLEMLTYGCLTLSRSFTRELSIKNVILNCKSRPRETFCEQQKTQVNYFN